MAGRKKITTPLPIGASGLPNLGNFDYESTASRQTDTHQTLAPASVHPRRPVVSVIAGADAGRVIAFGTNEAIRIGRSTDNDLVLPDTGVSRRHAVITRKGDRFFVEDLGSKNNTYVDDAEVLGSRQIDLGTTVQIGPHVTLRLVVMTTAEETLAHQLYESSMRDALTGTYNRRYLSDRVHAEISYAQRHKTPLSVGIVDFDHFKKINDEQGHAAGDEVLAQCASRIASTLRSEDVLARIGGEEFAFVLRGIAHDKALACARRVLTAISAHPIRLTDGELFVTASIGVASLDDCAAAANATNLFAVADERLYAAKRSGRNRVHGRG